MPQQNDNISTGLLSIVLPGVHEENILAFIYSRKRWNEDKFFFPQRLYLFKWTGEQLQNNN